MSSYNEELHKQPEDPPWWAYVSFLAAALGVTLLFGLTIATPRWLIDYYIMHNYTVRITDVDTQEIVYEGRSACVDTESRGHATHVKVYSEFLWCAGIPKYEFVGNIKEVTIRDE